GGLVDLALGVELGGSVGPARLYVGGQLGAGVTGLLVRPTLRLALGADLSVTSEWTIGPQLAYGHVFEIDDPTRSDDAQYLEVAVAVTFRPMVPPAAPPPVVRRPPRRRRRPPPPPPPPPVPEEEIVT